MRESILKCDRCKSCIQYSDDYIVVRYAILEIKEHSMTSWSNAPEYCLKCAHEKILELLNKKMEVIGE